MLVDSQWIWGMTQRVAFLKRRSDFGFFLKSCVELNLNLRFSGNSDGSGGLGEVF